MYCCTTGHLSGQGVVSRFHGGVCRPAIHQKRDDRVGLAFFADQLVGIAENDVASRGFELVRAWK